MSGIVLMVTVLLVQRGHMFGRVPVCLAVGIGNYFSPDLNRLRHCTWVQAFVGGMGLLFAKRFGEVLSPIVIGICLVGIGFSIAALRTHSLEAPVLGWRYYRAIEGRVVGMDRSASDAVRIIHDQVCLDRMSPSRTPQKVRISLHVKAAQGIEPLPGMRVKTTGHLSPSSGPAEPGGFDFQRHVWFGQLGVVGYTRIPLIGLAVATENWNLWVFQTRMTISARVREVIAGDVGGFAAAVTTGDRSGMGQEALGDLRASHTAHLLAISGLHMGLLSSVVLHLFVRF